MKAFVCLVVVVGFSFGVSSAYSSPPSTFKTSGSADSWTFEYPQETRSHATVHADLNADDRCNGRAIRLSSYDFEEKCRLRRYGSEYFEYCESVATATYRCL